MANMELQSKCAQSEETVKPPPSLSTRRLSPPPSPLSSPREVDLKIEDQRCLGTTVNVVKLYAHVEPVADLTRVGDNCSCPPAKTPPLTSKHRCITHHHKYYQEPAGNAMSSLYHKASAITYFCFTRPLLQLHYLH